MGIEIISGLRDIADRYDVLILDLWGVVHNGVEPYPGVLDCFDELHGAGKRIVLLSNAPRVNEKVQLQVAGFGVPRESYDQLVTSGDITRLSVSRREDPWFAALGKRYFHVGPERDWGLLEGAGVDEVDDLAAAEFVLCSGLYDDNTETADDYAEIFKKARGRDLPMICANPDLFVVRGERTVPCAGALGVAYEEMGGNVRYGGKPYPLAYEVCFTMLAETPKSRILAVGDSFRTDIAGANGAGIASLFIVGGIHADELGLGSDGGFDAEALTKAAQAAGHLPTAAVGGFYW
jgi:HAD superfamily hydrolase (TIGR01459 family)